MSSENRSMANIGDRIRFVRKNKGFSQIEFSSQLEITQSFLSGLERGRYQPTTDVLSRLANIYGVDINWLLTGQGKPETVRPPAIKAQSRVTELIGKMLEGMDEAALRDVLKYTEEKKLLNEFLTQQKQCRKAKGA